VSGEKKKFSVEVLGVVEKKKLEYDELLRFWKDNITRYSAFFFPDHKVVFVPATFAECDILSSIKHFSELTAELKKLVEKMLEHIKKAYELCEKIMEIFWDIDVRGE